MPKRARKRDFYLQLTKGDLPFITYHIDHVGPMEMITKQYNHILVIVDGFSRYVWLYPTRSTGVNEVLNCLDKQAVHFGNPCCVLSDRGIAPTFLTFKE